MVLFHLYLVPRENPLFRYIMEMLVSRPVMVAMVSQGAVNRPGFELTQQKLDKLQSSENNIHTSGEPLSAA